MGRLRRRVVVPLLAALGLLAPAGPAQATWTLHTAGSGAARASTLAAPATGTLTCAAVLSPKITWAAATNASGYQLYRKVGAQAQTLVAGGPFTGPSTTLTGGLSDLVGSLLGGSVTVTYYVQSVSGGPDAANPTGGWKSPTMTAATPSLTLGTLC